MAKQHLHLRRAALLIAGAVLVAALTATAAHAQPPPLPHAFYGSVEVNGQPAPVGVLVEARGAGVKTGIVTNPITVTVAGRYGGPTLSDPVLGVQGNITNGTPIEFYVGGVKAECARLDGSWQSSYPFNPGVITALNLRAGQSATPTATLTSTSTPRATNTPARTTAPATPTPGNITPTAVGATGAADATPTLQATQPVPPSSTPNAAGSAALVLSSPTPTGSAAGTEAAATAQASSRSAAGTEAAATAPALATPEPPKPGGAATALANAAQATSTRPPATLIARVTGAPGGTSAPILGAGAIADTVPAAGTAAASSRAMSSVLPWVGGGLLLLVLGLVGILVGLRLRKSGRIGRDSGEQP